MPLLFLEICACSGYSGNGQLLKKFFHDKKPVAPPTASSKMTTRVSALKSNNEDPVKQLYFQHKAHIFKLATMFLPLAKQIYIAHTLCITSERPGNKSKQGMNCLTILKHLSTTLPTSAEKPEGSETSLENIQLWGKN